MYDVKGDLFVYETYSGCPDIAYSHAMDRGIPRHRYYTDKVGETTELEALFLTVSNGDAVIIGTITDFMQPEIEDMLNTPENFNDLGVQIISRLEPDYEIKEYRKSIRLADRIARKRLGLKPV